MPWIQRYIIPLLAALGIMITIYTVLFGEKTFSPPAAIAEPAKPPYSEYVAGTGLVEASTQNVSVGSAVPGIVKEVLVKVGDVIKTGDVLLILDDRQAMAEINIREANWRLAEKNLERLLTARREEIPVTRAKVAEAEAQLREAKEQLAIAKALDDPRAISKEELQRRQYNVETTQARLQQVQASLKLLQAETWEKDISIARAQVSAALAQLSAAITEQDRLIIRSPLSGEVLQVNTRPGEYVSTVGNTIAPVIVGNTKTLHIRVDVDENDAWRVQPGSRATGSLRGNSQIKVDLRYVHSEPFVIPKRSLTGSSTERVDTRVLQLVFAFDRDQLPIYVGQQMDVFIESKPFEVVKKK